jgi:hypothetical protein
MLRIPRTALGGFAIRKQEPPGTIGRRTLRSLTTANASPSLLQKFEKQLPESDMSVGSGEITGGWLNGEGTRNLALLPKLPHFRVSDFDMTPISIRIE